MAGRRVSQKTRWPRHVERRRRELHDDYPCAMPTRRRRCPRHRIPIPQEKRLPDRWLRTSETERRFLKASTVRLSGICKPCRDELYQQLTAEYHDHKEETMQVEGTPIPGQMTVDEVIELAEAEKKDELVVYEPTPATLFQTSNPDLALERMAHLAELLMNVVRERKLVQKIGGNEYLRAPAWSVLAGLTGLSPATARVEKIEDGWLARVEVLRIADGVVISAAEQVCTRKEARWARAEDHALLGMAQTRAASRALRGPLMQVVELAGFKPTPVEEMPADVEPATDVVASSGEGKIPPEARPAREQLARISSLIAELGQLDPGPDWRATARELAGVDALMLTRAGASELIRQLERLVAGKEAA
jgi:hypothetical protein